MSLWSKKIYIFVLGLLIGFIYFIDYQKHQNKIEKEFPNDYLFRQRAYPIGKVKTDAYRKAISWKKKKKQERGTQDNLWEFIGPTNIGGRITAIEIPSNYANTYYVGAASGGVFKSTDAGANWNPIFDQQSMLSIGDIEISKNDNNLIYVGTGETNAGGGSLAYDGDGIYKSNNGGLTWENKGLNTVGSISKVMINSQNNAIIFAGAMGPLFKKDTNRGVYRSIDGGDSWDQILFVSDSTGIIDMAINHLNPAIIYAASWERIRRPNYRTYGGETSRIYKSDDGGDTWNELTNGLPSNPEQKGRISIDISYSNPNILYASYTDKTGYIQNIFKTENGGDTWTSLGSNGLYNTSYHWWFGGLFIDPNDENTVYHAGLYTGKTTNAGASWSNISPTSIHVDQHAIAFNPINTNEILLGNDGGLYKSTNNGMSFSFINNLPITQFYRFTVDEQNEDKRYGGAQDNSTIRTTSGAENDWNIIYGGDGFQPLIDPTNTNTIYVQYQRGNIARSLNNAASFSPILNGINQSDRNNWDTPICFNPDDSNSLLYGTHRVYKTLDRGNTWTPISPDLSNGPYTGNLSFGTITTLDISPLNTEIIYAGTDDGNVWVSENGGDTWTNISTDLPNLWTTKVKASSEDENTIYVTFSGYRYGDNIGHIFKSIDKGNTWNSISSDLPDIPINDIEIDQYTNLIIATDIGVFTSIDQGLTWDILGENFPSVVVTDLYFHKSSEYLYVATYGRSSYRIDLSNNAASNASETSFSDRYRIYPNPTENTLNINFKNNVSNVSIELFNLNGKHLKSYRINKEKSIQIDISNNISGIYFLKVASDQGSKIHRIIID